jgi:SNF2 family DNA or RNA helicase
MQQLNASWALNRLTPYELYVKVLLHLVRDRLSQQLRAMPSDFPPLADFQWAAVQTALQLLRRQNGVILGDVVGLGKTLMGTAMLKWLYARERWRALIIAPSPLVPMWEKFSKEFRLGAHVVGVGKLRQPGFVLEDHLDNLEPQIVLIDESHNFRHSDTAQYEVLLDFIHARGLPCILLTATPRNRIARDVYNQLHLFHPDDETDIGVSPPRLRDYFNLVQRGERALPPLLQHFMVRRTRRHIRSHWPDAKINGRPVHFPVRRLQTVIRLDHLKSGE